MEEKLDQMEQTLCDMIDEDGTMTIEDDYDYARRATIVRGIKKILNALNKNEVTREIAEKLFNCSIS